MTALSTFLESSLNFLSNNLKKYYKIWWSVKKAVSKFELSETQFERTARAKSPVKLTWSEKMTVLSTFLKSPLNFICNNLKNTARFGTERKAVSKCELSETQYL